MPFCIKCGTEVPESANFCRNCGNAAARAESIAVSAESPFETAASFTPAQAEFYKKTYLTTGFSFLAWIFLVMGLFQTGIANALLYSMGKVSWLLVLGIFWGASYIGEKLTFSENKEKQYLGLGIYIVAYALIFVPLLSLVVNYSHGNWSYAMDKVLIPAFISALTVFAALTVTVFVTKTDFSFLRTFVVFGSFFALGAIVILTISGTQVGSWFAIAMIILMSASLLYQTGKIKDEFDTSQHIGAAAMLFASFMVLLWYVIRLFINRDDD